MSEIESDEQVVDSIATSKRLVATVYLCQALTFMLAGLPLIVGVVLNFIGRNDAEGTWLESHFNWQIKTTWITLAGFSISGVTFYMGAGIFILLITVIWLVYRITLGWYALNDNKPVGY
ncbi:MAG: hypothetical protein NTY69_06145 [Methylococcales bacterium]|nr:hypothetical protein [Methylococcales bacterium]